METMSVLLAHLETQKWKSRLEVHPGGITGAKNEEDLGFTVCRYAHDIRGHACVRQPPPETPQIPQR
jgi:hypothetical protein